MEIKNNDGYQIHDVIAIPAVDEVGEVVGFTAGSVLVEVYGMLSNHIFFNDHVRLINRPKGEKCLITITN